MPPGGYPQAMILRTIELSDDLTALALDGPLDLAGVRENETKFLALTVARGKPVIVDFGAVSFIASMGLRLLIETAKGLDRKNCTFVIYQAAPEIRRVLDAAGMENVLQLADSEAAARSLASPI